MLRHSFLCSMTVLLEELTGVLHLPFEAHGLCSDEFDFTATETKTMIQGYTHEGIEFECEQEDEDTIFYDDVAQIFRYDFIDIEVLNMNRERVGFFRISTHYGNPKNSFLQLFDAKATDERTKREQDEWRFLRVMERDIIQKLDEPLRLRLSIQTASLTKDAELSDDQSGSFRAIIDFLCDVILYVKGVKDFPEPAKNSKPDIWMRYYYANIFIDKKITLTEIAQKVDRAERTVEDWKVEFDRRYKHYKYALDKINQDKN